MIGRIKEPVDRGGRVLGPEETRALLAALPWGSPGRAVAEIMVLTAGRLREVLRLRAGDVEGPVLRMRSYKGREVAVREHPITPRLRAVIASVLPPDAPPERHVILLNGRPPKDEGSFPKRPLRASRS